MQASFDKMRYVGGMHHQKQRIENVTLGIPMKKRLMKDVFSLNLHI